MSFFCAGPSLLPTAVSFNPTRLDAQKARIRQLEHKKVRFPAPPVSVHRFL
jgi:hypothetical protein